MLGTTANPFRSRCLPQYLTTGDDHETDACTIADCPRFLLASSYLARRLWEHGPLDAQASVDLTPVAIMPTAVFLPRSVKPITQSFPRSFHAPFAITPAQDRVGFKTLLDANALRHTCQHGRPGKWAAIIIQDEHNESDYEAYEYIYAPVRPLDPLSPVPLHLVRSLRS